MGIDDNGNLSILITKHFILNNTDTKDGKFQKKCRSSIAGNTQQIRCEPCVIFS